MAGTSRLWRMGREFCRARAELELLSGGGNAEEMRWRGRRRDGLLAGTAWRAATNLGNAEILASWGAASSALTKATSTATEPAGRRRYERQLHTAKSGCATRSEAHRQDWLCYPALS